MKQVIPALLRKNLVCLSAVVLLAFVGAGCSINLQHGKLNPPGRTYSDTIYTSKSATGSADLPKGADGRVGWGRGTLFAIPVVPVHVVGRGNEEVMKGIQVALTEVGYKVQVVEAGTPSPGKVLTCQVEKFKFNNYTWLFPIVPTWGGIRLNASLIGADQKVLWTHQFSGSGSTLDFSNGYTSSAKTSMTEILNEMITEFSSDEFHTALTK
jgi:hypothetical protein